MAVPGKRSEKISGPSKRTLILRPAAIADLRSATRYYDEQRPRLGKEFRDALDLVFARLQAFPRSAQRVAGFPGVRRALVGQFPFAIFYVAAEDAIAVLRIRHTARQPAGSAPDPPA